MYKPIVTIETIFFILHDVNGISITILNVDIKKYIYTFPNTNKIKIILIFVEIGIISPTQIPTIF